MITTKITSSTEDVIFVCSKPKKRKDEPCVRLNVLYIEPKLFGEFLKMVERRRIELLTPCVQNRCSPS